MKKITIHLTLCLLFFSMSFTYLRAQQLTGQLQVFGDVNDDLLIATDASSNLYFANNFHFLAKHDVAGALTWSIPAGPPLITAMTLDASANVYIAGTFLGSATFGTTTLNNSTSGKSNIYVVKYNSDGVFQWAVATGEYVDNVKGIAVDASGNIFLAGKITGSGNMFGSTSLSSSGTSGDTYVAKLDNSGAALWAKASVSNAYASFGGLTVDGSGNAYLAGSFGSSVKFGTRPTLTSASNDVFVAKYDPSGTALWSNAVTYTGNDAAYGIAADASGNVYMTGIFNQSRLFVLKYATDGSLQWSSVASGPSFSQGNGIAVDSDGNSYVTGYFNGSSVTIGDTTLYGSNGKEAVILKLDTDSHLSWSGVGTGDSDEEGTAICTNGTTLYFIGYSESSTFSLGYNALTGTTEFIATMRTDNLVTSTATGNKVLTNLYPNPTSGTIQLSGLEESLWKVKVNTLSGRCIYQSEQSGSSLTIDLSTQAKGIYVLELYKEEAYSGVAKIVVE